MTRSLTIVIMTIAMSAWHVAAYGMRAEADSVSMEGHIDEVTVASVKTNKHNLTPASISLVGPAMLRTQQLTEVTELSGVMPNFFIPDYGSKQTTPIAIRGVMSKAKGMAVGFYTDGMPHFEISSFDSDLLDVKAIEIYRGPQGTLYGRNTLGGVINIYTYSPFEYQGTKIRLGYGNYNNINVQASHHSKIGDKFGFNIGGYYKHKDGYFTNEYLGEKADKSNEGGGKIGIFIRPVRSINIRVNSNYDYLNQGGYPYAPYDIETGKTSAISYDHESGFKRKLSTNGLNFNYNNNVISINYQTTLQLLKEEMGMDQDYTTAHRLYTSLDFRQKAISEELTVKSENEGRVQWIGGLFIFHQVRDYKSDAEYIEQQYISTNKYKMPTTGIAAFMQVSYNIWRELSLTAGIRFDHEKSKERLSKTKATQTDLSGQYIESAQKTNDVMPKFGMQYKWDNRTVVFGNITRGCKAGGFNAVFEKDDERTYDDEYNWNYEVGFKYTSKGKRVSAEATLFYIDWKKQHISRTIPGLGTTICNAGHSSSKGVETAIALRPLTGLMVQANYGYTYAKFIDYKKSATQDYSDNMIPLVPRNTLSLIGSYSIAPAKGLDLITLSVNTNSIGKLYWMDDNKVCQHLYTTLGAKASVAKGPATLEIWGKNLTNKEYLSYCFTSSSTYAQEGLPMTMGATLNLKL